MYRLYMHPISAEEGGGRGGGKVYATFLLSLLWSISISPRLALVLAVVTEQGKSYFCHLAQQVHDLASNVHGHGHIFPES